MKSQFDKPLKHAHCGAAFRSARPAYGDVSKNMRYSLLMLLAALVSGCDSINGLRMPVVPAFEGDWGCVVDSLPEYGMRGKIDELNQLNVKSVENGGYLFSVDPKRDGTMQLYFLQMHMAPECHRVSDSFRYMNQFIDAMETNCSYKATSYSANMDCLTNK